MMRRYLLAWVPMIFIAIANGALREAFLTPALGELQWRQLSTLLLIVWFALYTAAVTRIWPIESARQAAGIGVTGSC